MSLQEMRALLQELMSALTLSIQSGETLPDELQMQIAQALEMLYERIEAAEGQEQPTAPAAPSQPPNIEGGPFPSSNVNGFKYDPRSGRLFVQFHGPYPQAAGPIYQYENVPKHIYDVFSEGRVGPTTSGQNQYHRWIRGVTPSLGASLNALIKNGGYPYQRISG